jgi:glycosyltransferase involved in cell wall biosynthesis
VDLTLTVEALGPQLSGIGRYVSELCRRVPSEPGIDRVRYFANGRFVDGPHNHLDVRNRRQRIRLPRGVQRRLVQGRLRRALVHGPNYFLPRGVEAGIITVHDLSVLRYPETHPPERVKMFEREFHSSLERAAHVITDTATIRREIIEDLGVPEGIVTAIGLGVGDEYHPRSAAELEPELAPLGLRFGEYALCVSTLEPRKKIDELIRAWGDLPPHLRNSTPLVLVGSTGWLNDHLHDQIRRGTDAGWLKHLGFVPERVLLALYAGASLFIYPSTYEGFGLPPVEAMASGVPVLVANRSCLPEVCGDAVGYVDPDDVQEFGRAIAEALTNSTWRDQARAKGLKRASGFSWEKCSKETAELYRRYKP